MNVVNKQENEGIYVPTEQGSKYTELAGQKFQNSPQNQTGSGRATKKIQNVERKVAPRRCLAYLMASLRASKQV